MRVGLSLSEISARTKIRTALLEAIEREDFDRLPSGLLARGLLRAYARAPGYRARLCSTRRGSGTAWFSLHLE